MSLGFLGKARPLLTTSGLEKSDLGKNRFYSALNMPYPNGKIIAAERVQAVYWLHRLANYVAVAIRYARVAVLLHAAICPHACKLIADWLSCPTVVCAWYARIFDELGLG